MQSPHACQTYDEHLLNTSDHVPVSAVLDIYKLLENHNVLTLRKQNLLRRKERRSNTIDAYSKGNWETPLSHGWKVIHRWRNQMLTLQWSQTLQKILPKKFFLSKRENVGKIQQFETDISLVYVVTQEFPSSNGRIQEGHLSVLCTKNGRDPNPFESTYRYAEQDRRDSAYDMWIRQITLTASTLNTERKHNAPSYMRMGS